MIDLIRVQSLNVWSTGNVDSLPGATMNKLLDSDYNGYDIDTFFLPGISPSISDLGPTRRLHH